MIILTDTITATPYTYNYVDGYGVRTAGTPLQVRCNIQPIAGEELERLEVNDRKRKPVFILSYERIDPFVEVEIDGEIYEIQQTEDWNRQPFLKHFEVVALRKTEEGQLWK